MPVSDLSLGFLERGGRASLAADAPDQYTGDRTSQDWPTILAATTQPPSTPLPGGGRGPRRRNRRSVRGTFGAS